MQYYVGRWKEWQEITILCSSCFHPFPLTTHSLHFLRYNTSLSTPGRAQFYIRQKPFCNLSKTRIFSNLIPSNLTYQRFHLIRSHHSHTQRTIIQADRQTSSSPNTVRPSSHYNYWTNDFLVANFIIRSGRQKRFWFACPNWRTFRTINYTGQLTFSN